MRKFPVPRLAPLTLHGHQEYAIASKEWIGPLPDSKGCADPTSYIGGQPSKVLPMALLVGFPLLSNVYTALKFGDTPQIGFVQLSDAARGVVPERVYGNAAATPSVPFSSAVGKQDGVDSANASAPNAQPQPSTACHSSARAPLIMTVALVLLALL